MKSAPELKTGVEISFSELKEICEYFGLYNLWIKIERDPPSIPFKSDGCTKWFDSWNGKDLTPACWKHDLKYWAGYSGESVERLIADAELMIEIATILNGTHFAEIMFRGVRFGGSSSWGNSRFTWGFGRETKDKK